MKGGVNETRAKQNLRNVTVDIRSTMSTTNKYRLRVNEIRAKQHVRNVKVAITLTMSNSNYMSTLWVNIHSLT